MQVYFKLKTHLCSSNDACTSVKRTIDLAYLSSADTREQCTLPNIWASSFNFCA